MPTEKGENRTVIRRLWGVDSLQKKVVSRTVPEIPEKVGTIL
jgi:hypothetical protein